MSRNKLSYTNDSLNATSKWPKYVQNGVKTPRLMPKYGYPQRKLLSNENNWVSAAEIAIIIVKLGYPLRR